MSAAADLDVTVDTATDAASEQGVGPSLRRLRELQGWSTDDVSVRLKFSARQIEALENERWEELPKGLSLRGLVRNYARMLGTDPQALLAALAPTITALSAQREPSLVDGTSRPLYEESGDSDTYGSLLWIIVILIVLGVALVYAFDQGWLLQTWLPSAWFADSVPDSTPDSTL